MIRLVRLLPMLVLLGGVPAGAHEPHKPAAPAGSTSPAAAAIPLPAGWSESRPPAAAEIGRAHV